MIFGGESVEVGNAAYGTPGDWNIPEETITWTVVSGCRFRPLSTTETVELYDRASEVWRLTAPPVAALLSATSTSLIRHNNVIYEIDGGIKPFTDASGLPFKVTVMCKRQQVQIS